MISIVFLTLGIRIKAVLLTSSFPPINGAIEGDVLGIRPLFRTGDLP
jgi:hypothetical protein